MKKRSTCPHWSRVPGSYKTIRGFGYEFVRECQTCKRTNDETETPTAIECGGCGSHFYELALPPTAKPKVPKPDQADAKSRAIAARIRSARFALETALDDVARAVARVNAHRAKISRLAAALRTPVEVRQQRALKALQTKARPKRRAMQVGGAM